MSKQQFSIGKSPRVGLFGIGLDAYWPQFAGLEERLMATWTRSRSEAPRPGVEVVNLGLIDTPEKAAGRRAPVPPGGRRPHLPLRHDVRAVVDRAAGRAPGEGAGHRAEPRSRRPRSTTRRSTRWATARR